MYRQDRGPELHHGRGRGGRGGRRGGRRHGHGRRNSPQTRQRNFQGTGPSGSGNQGIATVSETDPLAPEVLPYIRRWRALVQMEQDEEQRMVNERLSSWSLDRLRREGIVLMDLVLKKHGTFFGKMVIRAKPRDGGPLPFNRFGSGDLVTICRNNPRTEKTVEGAVLEKGRFELKLVCDQKPAGMESGLFRLDQGVNTIAYDRMRAAVAAIAKVPSSVTRRPEAAALTDQGGYHGKKKRGRRDDAEEEETGPIGTWLREHILRAGQGCNFSPTYAELCGSEAAELASWLEHPSPNISPSDPAFHMNISQRNAAALALKNRLTVLQGPPGTGKTTTIISYIWRLIFDLKVTGNILACASSNVAVDNLLEGLLAIGVEAVRVGQPVKVREVLRKHCLDSRLQTHPLFDEIEKSRRELAERRRKLPTQRGKDRGLGHRNVSVLSKQVKKDKEKLMQEVLMGAQVICSTCVNAGSDILEGMDFPIVILDEGSQCCEAESLIPLMRGSCHVVLVGDHCQLPPVIMSPEAKEGGMTLSLFERLIQGGHVPSTMLQVQYRMHPSISEMPNRLFYQGRVADGIRPEDRPRPPFRFPSLAHPVAFVESVGQEETSQGGSKLNRQEACLVQKIVADLIRAREPPAGIGVITPYTAQLHVLNDLLGSYTSANMDEPEKGLEIKTVDGYQGREKDIIVFSTVRSNANGQVGFLDDWRRMNVALTRARRALIILGNSRTLRTSPHWARYIEWLARNNAIMLHTHV